MTNFEYSYFDHFQLEWKEEKKKQRNYLLKAEVVDAFTVNWEND